MNIFECMVRNKLRFPFKCTIDKEWIQVGIRTYLGKNIGRNKFYINKDGILTTERTEALYQDFDSKESFNKYWAENVNVLRERYGDKVQFFKQRKFCKRRK